MKASTALLTTTLASLLLFLPSTPSDDFACIDPSQKENLKYRIGDRARMCVFYMPSQVKMVYELTIDEPQILSGQLIWKFFEPLNIDVFSQIGGTNKYSPIKPLYRDSSTYAYPLVLYTITLHKGLVIDIAQENIVDFCPENVSEVKNIRYRSDVQLPFSFKDRKKKGMYCHVKCKEDGNGDNGKCDPMMLVTWRGTDYEGELLLSNFDSVNTYDEYNKTSVLELIKELYKALPANNGFDRIDFTHDMLARVGKD